jgi:hypothetical protein
MGHERKNSAGLANLSRAHACFKGIRRPCAEDDDGSEILAYVLKPSRFFVYEPGMASMLAEREAPTDLVFVVYVRLDAPCAPGGSDLKGVVTHWHFVEADEADDTLPVDFASRYAERLW